MLTFGGEPLPIGLWSLNSLITEKEGPKHGKELRLTITTNGVLLDEDKTEYINQHFKNIS